MSCRCEIPESNLPKSIDNAILMKFIADSKLHVEGQTVQTCHRRTESVVFHQLISRLTLIKGIVRIHKTRKY